MRPKKNLCPSWPSDFYSVLSPLYSKFIITLRHIQSTGQDMKSTTGSFSRPVSQFPVLPLPLLFDCPLAPQQIVTRSSGWNLPPWSGTALQDPRTASVAADGVYVNSRDWTFQTRRLQLWWFLLRYSGNPGIITMPFAIYLIKMEKHGFSQFVRNFSLSIVSSHKKRTVRRYPSISRAL